MNLPLDREHTTAALGFRAHADHPPIYAQLTRGKFELAALEALGGATLDLRRIVGPVAVHRADGSASSRCRRSTPPAVSIMPNKRNPDVIELMRATHASVAAARTEIEQLLSLPSGYHRDLQSSKGAIFHGFGRGLAALELLPALLAHLEWRDDRLLPQRSIRACMPPTSPLEAAVAGVPFREATRPLQPVPTAQGRDVPGRQPGCACVSPGSAADLRLDELRARWQALS